MGRDKLLEQIERDKAAADAMPEATREAYRREMAAMFHNPGIVFPKRKDHP